MLKPAVNIMVKAARAAGNIILRHVAKLDGLNIVEKARQDYASEVDALAEKEIIRELRRAFPDHAFLCEESGALGQARFTFVIDPSRTTYYYLGAGNSITFPAGSLCDPSRSTYGMGQWDRWCPVATSPVTIYTKAWLDRYGQPHIDFDKHVRFVPTEDPAGWVMLTLSDYGTGINPWTNISYCATEYQTSCIDEAAMDPSCIRDEKPGASGAW